MSFREIEKEITKNSKYQSLKNDYHHGLNRYHHLIHVAKGTYYISKILKLDYISATRGAFLHDYFNNEEYLDVKGINKPRIHPFLALNNAKCEYNLNLKEENIIISHMFPIGKIKPTYYESWIVSCVDKIVAIFEYLNYRFKDKFAVYMIFLINFLSIRLTF